MNAKIIASIAAGVMALSSFAAQAAQELRAGTHPVFAPFEFMDTSTKEYAGFDIDLIRELGKRAGYDVKIVSMGFDGLIPALMTGSIDVAIAGMTITPERAKKVEFSAPYYDAGQGLMVREADKAKYTDLKSLEGKKIAVELGTTGAAMAKGIKGASVKAFDSGSEAFMDLKAGGSDAVILDKPVIGYFIVKNPKGASGLVQQPSLFGKESFGIAAKKGNKALINKLNKALEEMKKDGSYQKLHAKWFAD